MPAPQVLQVAELAAANLPAGHVAHVADDVAPVVADAVPLAQAVQLPLPDALHVPLGHVVHEVLPAALYVPAAHALQLAAPADAENEPAAQSEHVAEPAALNLPAGHDVQVADDVAPVVADAVPAAHCVQLP